MSDLVFIEANGERITEWTEYAVDSDLLTPADGFSFSVAIPKEDARGRDELRAVLSLGTEVKIYVGDAHPHHAQQPKTWATARRATAFSRWSASSTTAPST